jgi:hypothetical protein
MSRGPISTRRGTPFLIQSQPRAPPMSRRRSPPAAAAAVSQPGQAAASVGVVHHLARSFGLVRNGQQNHLGRGDPGRQIRPSSSPWVMITPPIRRVEDAPGSGPGQGFGFLGGLEADIGGPGEILAQKMGGAGLQGLAVLHHGLDALGVHGSRKAFRGGLAAFDHRHGQESSAIRAVDIQHHGGAFASASWAVAWAVWPSCQRNSLVRRKMRVRISHRTTLAH